jgi:O-antigen/teichoic acid export membrane protein
MAYPLFYTLSETTAVGLGITRRSMLSMTASIIAELVNLIGCFLLVPRYGAAGAGISTAIAFWIFFFCRTEFAIRAWRPLPRVKLYVTTLVCLGLAVPFTIVGERLHAIFIGLWLLVLVISAFIFKQTVMSTAQRLFVRRPPIT